MLDSHESKLHQNVEDQQHQMCVCVGCVCLCMQLGGRAVGRIDGRDLQLKAILLGFLFPR